MPWTVESLRAAYRLTSTDALIERALADAEYQERRLLGPRLNGGTATYTWRLRIGVDWGHQFLGLPYQGERLVSLRRHGEEVDDAYLTDNGWSIQRETIIPFLFGTHTADVVLVDDSGHRDMMQASLVMEALGMPPEAAGRGWRRLVSDIQGPGMPARLPDERAIAVPGSAGATTRHYYAGTVAGIGDPVALRGLEAQDGRRFNLPAWTGRRYIVFASSGAQAVTGITIAGLDQTPAFRMSQFSEGGQQYTEWRSRQAWDGAVASGAAVVLE